MWRPEGVGGLVALCDNVFQSAKFLATAKMPVNQEFYFSDLADISSGSSQEDQIWAPILMKKGKKEGGKFTTCILCSSYVVSWINHIKVQTDLLHHQLQAFNHFQTSSWVNDTAID